MSINKLPNGKYVAKACGREFEAFTRIGALKIAAKRIWESAK